MGQAGRLNIRMGPHCSIVAPMRPSPTGLKPRRGFRERPAQRSGLPFYRRSPELLRVMGSRNGWLVSNHHLGERHPCGGGVPPPERCGLRNGIAQAWTLRGVKAKSNPRHHNGSRFPLAHTVSGFSRREGGARKLATRMARVSPRHPHVRAWGAVSRVSSHDLGFPIPGCFGCGPWLGYRMGWPFGHDIHGD